MVILKLLTIQEVTETRRGGNNVRRKAIAFRPLIIMRNCVPTTNISIYR